MQAVDKWSSQHFPFFRIQICMSEVGVDPDPPPCDQSSVLSPSNDLQHTPIPKAPLSRPRFGPARAVPHHLPPPTSALRPPGPGGSPASGDGPSGAAGPRAAGAALRGGAPASPAAGAPADRPGGALPVVRRETSGTGRCLGTSPPPGKYAGLGGGRLWHTSCGRSCRHPTNGFF